LREQTWWKAYGYGIHVFLSGWREIGIVVGWPIQRSDGGDGGTSTHFLAFADPRFAASFGDPKAPCVRDLSCGDAR
jgi:hypothetical protein